MVEQLLFDACQQNFQQIQSKKGREQLLSKHRISKTISFFFLVWVSMNSVIIFLEGVQCQKQGSDNYYDLLEVPRHASKAEIKKAWRKLSMKYHPDKNPGDEKAADQIQSI